MYNQKKNCSTKSVQENDQSEVSKEAKFKVKLSTQFDQPNSSIVHNIINNKRLTNKSQFNIQSNYNPITNSKIDINFLFGRQK